MRVRLRDCALVAAVVTGFLGGCASSSFSGKAVTRGDALRMERDGLAVEYVGALDRFTFFGPEGGPNLLHVEGLEREAAADEAYTFYGGCYTWVGPQKGWVGPGDSAREWPPDPAMDVGPGKVTWRGADWFETATPASRLGFREVKRFEIVGREMARLSYTLENVGADARRCAPWVNTAVGKGSVVAVRWEAGVTRVWGWDDQTVARFKSLLEPVAGTGWALVDLDRADWDGGGKVWLDSKPEIAIWTDGYWLVRRVEGSVDIGALNRLGEGPVAMYIQPGGGDAEWIVEAELYGAAAEVGAGDAVSSTESWSVVRGGKMEVGVLGH